MDVMNSAVHLGDHASDLLNAARGFHIAAGEPESARIAPAALGNLEEALEALSTSWFQLAADAASSREQLSHPIAMHDVAFAFARCAAACRHARSTVAPLIGGCATAKASSQFPRFERRERPTGRAA
jgi:hypothetical protein